MNEYVLYDSMVSEEDFDSARDFLKDFENDNPSDDYIYEKILEGSEKHIKRYTSPLGDIIKSFL